ncbi:malate dehydrogenase (quinone) [Acerihabitans arboris]|uniref:Probable malate:quinone oxidoreductase n=1 Tax=Acerihabitans arboris TaxID=2691583 RepID=A0A845SSC3_9GAMM|nr:malate dehydrogenase (quinone) [Acerihabitans arboris]NDL65756.1 malate dehydrogenase (quinone) [Acerihabitans arboris]
MKEHFIASLCMNMLASSQRQTAANNAPVDLVLIGGGVMSATLGTYLKELEPDWTINMYERLDKTAEESSNGWNNAGTGHAAYCELNYTPEMADGSIDIAKAVSVNESYEVSRQFWAYLVKNNILGEPGTFINNVPHMSFVWGDENVNYLRKRYAALQRSTLFQGMEYTEDSHKIRQWAPMIMEGREPFQKVAATRMTMGTDVNFGELTRQMLDALERRSNVNLHLRHDVLDISRNDDNTWTIKVADLNNNGKQTSVRARHIFIGAGGASLRLLQKSGIPEARGYAGFPVGGKFLVTTRPEVVNGHLAKVYGKASVGAPPMSVPHIDTRMLDGKRTLLFGPYATFSSKFLKSGSWLDLFGSLTLQNLMPMIRVGLDNFGLLGYLVSQSLMSDKKRLSALKEYYPEARLEDWELTDAGQRVQIIKKDAEKGGILQFGTEVVSSADGTLSALLGASPGASTAAPIMLQLLESMFKQQASSAAWRAKLQEMIPTYGRALDGNVEMTNKIRAYTSDILRLTCVEATHGHDASISTGVWDSLPKAI